MWGLKNVDVTFEVEIEWLHSHPTSVHLISSCVSSGLRQQVQDNQRTEHCRSNKLRHRLL